MNGNGPLQLSLFDEQDLAEIDSPDFPGERLIACRNPALAGERARKREALLAATEKGAAAVPCSLDEYYQEIGRCGRDGQPGPGSASPGPGSARAAEVARQLRSVERSGVEMMRRYAEMTDSRRRFLLRYFGEDVSDACGACDNCDAGRSRPVVATGLFSPGERVTHYRWGPGLVLEATQVVSGRHLLAPA